MLEGFKSTLNSLMIHAPRINIDLRSKIKIYLCDYKDLFKVKLEAGKLFKPQMRTAEDRAVQLP